MAAWADVCTDGWFTKEVAQDEVFRNLRSREQSHEHHTVASDLLEAFSGLFAKVGASRFKPYASNANPVGVICSRPDD